MAGWVVIVAKMAESMIRLQRARLRAQTKILVGTRRERDVLVDHWARLLVVATAADPKGAADAAAALNLDLTRLHALGLHISRQEQHERPDAR